ncbi:MAG TPA: lysylphosphatidylglycerol synthase transmembrane domain-containing protein [Anaerolineales bacterium]|nr:lysylphosphatidylglycerol synthase transmembrane domain-containing protein [Anaerolineales bacterium]
MSVWWAKNRRLVLQLAGTVLAIVLLVVLLRDRWNEIVEAFKNIKTSNLLWVGLLFLTSRVATVGRWHVLLRSGGVDIRLKDSASLTFTGLFASNFLPTSIGGDVVRLAGAMQMGFDRAVCLASIAADRLIGMAGMTMMLPVGLFHSWSLLENLPASLSAAAWFNKPIVFLKRTFSIFNLWLKKPASLLGSLAFTWVHMLCLFGSIYIFADDLGNHASFWMIAGLWSLTYFITLIPISVNGYGLQELSFTFFMSNVAGWTPAVSLSVAVLIRAFSILASLPGALFLPSIMSALAEQKKKSSSGEILL